MIDSQSSLDDRFALLLKSQREFEEELSREFFAEKRSIPDLEFDTPECSICTHSTTYEDGAFYCEVCEVGWPQTGNGRQAWRENE